MPNDFPTGTRLEIINGKRLLLYGNEEAQVFSISKLRPTSAVMYHHGGIAHVAVSPNGTKIATTGHDGTSRVWNAVTGEPVCTLRGHSKAVSTASFGPDSVLIVTGSHDNTARIWDADTGELVTAPLPHFGSVQLVAFAPDGKQVLTWSRGVVSMWPLSTTSESVRDLQSVAATLTGGYRVDMVGELVMPDESASELWQRLAPLWGQLQQRFPAELGRDSRQNDSKTRRLVEGDIELENPVSAGVAEVYRLGVAHMDGHRYDAAEPLIEFVLQRQRRSVGDEHPVVLELMLTLGEIYKSQKRYVQAESMYRGSLEIHRRTKDADNPQAMQQLADVLRLQGRDAEAESLLGSGN